VPNDKYCLFVDDLNLFICDKSKTEIIARVQCISVHLNEWSFSNKAEFLNLKKLHIQFFLLPKNGIILSLGKTSLTRKYVGVRFVADLTWTDHIDIVYNKLMQYVYISFYKL